MFLPQDSNYPGQNRTRIHAFGEGQVKVIPPWVRGTSTAQGHIKPQLLMTSETICNGGAEQETEVQKRSSG
jgi:hypothetical protein